MRGGLATLLLCSCVCRRFAWGTIAQRHFKKAVARGGGKATPREPPPPRFAKKKNTALKSAVLGFKILGLQLLAHFVTESVHLNFR
jgi:hypothetical protein